MHVKSEIEHLQGLVDDLRVVHGEVLETLEQTRAERDLLLKVLGFSNLFLASLDDRIPARPEEIRCHLDRAIDGHAKFRGLL
jgi:hypothetical protein